MYKTSHYVPNAISLRKYKNTRTTFATFFGLDKMKTKGLAVNEQNRKIKITFTRTLNDNCASSWPTHFFFVHFIINLGHPPFFGFSVECVSWCWVGRSDWKENPKKTIRIWSLEIGGTAVASMRRTEALASVKFYQILSIFIFFIRLIILCMQQQ